MTVLFAILGILLIITGFSCIFTPLATWLSFGYFVVVLMFVSGIIGIIRSIAAKKFGGSFVFSILSIVLGGVMLASPEGLLLTKEVLLLMTAIWFAMMGIVTIIDAVSTTRKIGSKIWILQLIFGILAVLIGCYSFFYPMLLAVTEGIMIGVFFIETGFTLMFSGIAAKD